MRALRISMIGLMLAIGASPASSDPPPRTPVISVGATSDSYPYSYLDDRGRLTGFAVDLLDAVAKAKGLNLRRVIASGDEINRRFAAGEFDVNQYFAYLPSRTAFARFSAPFLFNDGAIFERRGDHRFPTIQDLRKGRAIVATAAAGQKEFALDYGFDPAQVRILSTEEAIRQVADGRCDAAMVTRISGLAQIDRLGIRNLVMAGPPVGRYPSTMAFAVHPEEAQLLVDLNDGLAHVYQTGEFDAIYRRWFGRYQPHTFTREEVVAYVAGALALALVVALWALVRQHQLRRRIAQSNEVLGAFHENLPHAIGVVEAKGSGWSVVSLNPDGVRLLGLSAAPALPCPFSRLGLPADALREWEGLFSQGLAAGAPVKIERRSPDGRRDYVATLVPLGRAGLSPRCCFLVEDVTDQKQKDAEIAQGRRLRALGELVGGIAHEFNNLLTPILMKAEDLRASWAHDRGLSEDLALIAGTARRSAELTQRLLAFGRRKTNEPVRFELTALVENTVTLLRQTTDRRIEVECLSPPDLPSLYLCSSAVHQIVFNLLLNARDTLVEKLARPASAPVKAWIRVETRRRPAGAVEPFGRTKGPGPEGWIEIEVSDNGMGMPPQVLERIFEPFYTTKEVGQGTGLGLATVWHLVAELGGRIDVASELGEGSSFRVSLPVIAPPIGAPKPPPDAAPLPAARRSLSLLVVDDEADIASILAKYLRRLGYTVATMGNGLDAWDLIAEFPQRFDALVLDINLAGLTGVELARRARLLSPGLPILVMSGRVTDPDRAEMAGLGVASVLQKPFTLEEFGAAVSALVAPPPTG
jgi:two-component system cell cycle sensor histidine kinase/response regulator CckA